MEEYFAIQIKGVVQGVGFRPFVYRLARELGLAGFVRNISSAVEITVCCGDWLLKEFCRRIKGEAPPNSVIEELIVKRTEEAEVFSLFEIRKSLGEESGSVRISPDLPLCNRCLAEVTDPGNRRYYYPYINCTDCGPRYTIVEGVPYDRQKTTMKDFIMCPECQHEYEDPGDRRFHAQPDACHRCGPHLMLRDRTGAVLMTPGSPKEYKDFFSHAGGLLREGNILAIKGLGGYHLACNALDSTAVKNLRSRKYREEKPFAVMCHDEEAAGKIGFISPGELHLLKSQERPIVLLSSREPFLLSPHVALGNRHIGVMLPYTPLQHLLFRHIDFPLVMTSANLSDEPICFEDEEALMRLKDICDYFITGSREILIRCDDPVVRTYRGQEYPLRRARGAVPSPVLLEKQLSHPVLAVGAEQKNCICLAKGNRAFLSQHIGDLKNAATLQAFTGSILHLSDILDIRPSLVACDLHPEYLSTKTVFDPPASLDILRDLPVIPVQHHEAHVASCMADNGLSGPVIGIALDGTGYGTDGTVWGGEIFITDVWRRRFSFLKAPMAGADLAVKRPWRMALGYIYSLFGGRWREHLPPQWCSMVESGSLPEKEMEMAVYQIMNGINTPLTSSCGRLFDAFSALAGIRMEAFYEGQGAVELEQLCSGPLNTGYIFEILDPREPLSLISWENPLREVLRDLSCNVSPSVISARFHAGLIDILLKACHIIKNESGIREVALSGGCFMNMILLENLAFKLEEAGFRVYTHRQVPCNDGGIALGQVYLAAIRQSTAIQAGKGE